MVSITSTEPLALRVTADEKEVMASRADAGRAKSSVRRASRTAATLVVS
jgi:hypothetical protein